MSAAVAAVAIILAFSGLASAAAPTFRDPEPDRFVYDTAEAFPNEARRATNQVLRDLEARTGVRVVVYTLVDPGSASDPATADADSALLLTEWGLGGRDSVALVWAFDRGRESATIGIAVSETLAATGLDHGSLRSIVDDATADDLAAGRWLAALTQATVAVSVALPSNASTPAPGVSPGPAPTPTPGVFPGTGSPPSAGPPYPDPVSGRVVYDFAEIFTAGTEEQATAMIVAIEERTGAEVVVYSQVKPESDTVAEAEHDAIALMDQWGVGRKGIDDGLAILFDMDASRCHGQVQLYAGPGYRAAYLGNEERQRIFDEDMLPRLRSCDLDEALLVALQRVDENATPAHAADLERGRQVNALLGIVGAPLALVLLVGWAGSSWLRYGKDPVYLDDPSILMPAPPPELTPAAGALLFDGRSSRHTLTTAMVHLAGRGDLAFRKHERLLRDKVGIEILEGNEADPLVARNRRKLALGRAEEYALERLRSLAKKDRIIEPDDLPEFGKSVEKFDRQLEKHVAGQGWFREPPNASIERWSFRGGIALVVGVILAVVAFNLPSSGLLLLGAAVAVGGVAMMVVSRVMPARTMAGAMLFAMLAAYRRTLQKTMQQARSMDQVVAGAGLPWIETPDQAAVWGVALGLQKEVQQVLERSIEDLRSGQATPATVWTPLWYGDQSSFASGGGEDGTSVGLFSDSAIPDFDGMMSAIGTIGDSPSSSGSGSGSGGFSGGGSGGGGGGSGGGF
ncbi:MAG: TPM domain-containing protein [Chloroflexi bacterium]|nr:TPM domain-containing protein [Chloroflexota bacterium]